MKKIFTRSTLTVVPASVMTLNLYTLAIAGPGSLDPSFWTSGKSALVLRSSSNFSNFFGFPFGASGVKLYVNGVELASTAQTTSTNNITPLRIGNDFTGTRDFDGLIDEAAIYNRALSAAEIQAVFNAGTSGKCKPTATLPPTGQTGWWAGDGDALDIAGANHGTMQNGAGFAVGKAGQSFSFDGANDSVQLPLAQTFQNFTLETWVKPLSAINDPIGQELIFGQASFGAQIAVIQGAGGGMLVKVQYRDTSASFAQLTGTTEIPLALGGLPPLPFSATTTGLTYDISTSAVFTGSPTVCFNVSALAAQFGFLRILHLENGVWVNRTNTAGTSPNLCTTALPSLSPFAIVNGLSPTAATVAVGGRILSAKGDAISKARVSITDPSGETRTALTNSFGFYQFEDVEVGRAYVFSVEAKRHQFQPQSGIVMEEPSGLDFTADY
jgi:hypothetical protein